MSRIFERLIVFQKVHSHALGAPYKLSMPCISDSNAVSRSGIAAQLARSAHIFSLLQWYYGKYSILLPRLQEPINAQCISRCAGAVNTDRHRAES